MKKKTLIRLVTMVMAFTLLISGMPYALAAQKKAEKPNSVTLNASTKTMLPGESFAMAATVVPADASQAVTWKSSNKSVAKVSKTGVVTAVKTGKTTITASTKNGKKAKCTLTVNLSFSATNVRFYGIGNENYQTGGALDGVIFDVRNMEAYYLLSWFGSKRVSSVRHEDLTAAQIRSTLQSIVDNPTIDEDDITIFYYAGHGVGSNNPDLNGALVGIDGQYVTVSAIQSYLDRVKGNVVVILDCCHSGQFITPKGSQPTTAQAKKAAASFNNAWISNLSSSKAGNFTAKSLSNSPVNNKYHVLTAASASQLSWSIVMGDVRSYGLFTECLTRAFSSRSATDKDKNAFVSLGEAYTTSNALVKDFVNFYWPATSSYPVALDVQVWPNAKDPFPIFGYKQH